MKKRWFVVLFSLLTVLSGCGHSAHEYTGEIFINRLAYQKEGQAFNELFENGAQLGAELDANKTKFKQAFSENLTAEDQQASEALIDELTDRLFRQVAMKTRFRIADIKETGSTIKITYLVTGLDFIGAMKETSREVIQQALEEPDFAEKEQHILKETLTILNQNVDIIKIESEPIELSIVLEKKGGVWHIPNDQKQQTYHLFMAFMTGTKNTKDMNQQLYKASSQVFEEAIQAIEEE